MRGSSTVLKIFMKEKPVRVVMEVISVFDWRRYRNASHGMEGNMVTQFMIRRSRRK